MTDQEQHADAVTADGATASDGLVEAPAFTVDTVVKQFVARLVRGESTPVGLASIADNPDEHPVRREAAQRAVAAFTASLQAVLNDPPTG